MTPLLSPTSSRRIKTWMVLVAFGALIFLFMFLGAVLRMIIIAALLAYIIDPVVTSLELRGMTRTTATVIISVAILGAITVLCIVVIPALIDQLQSMQASVTPEKTRAIFSKIEHFIQHRFGFLGLENFDLNQKVQEKRAEISARMVDYLLTDVISLIITIVTIPVIIFFFLKDGREIKKGLVGIVPNRFFEFVLDLLYKMDMQLGNYLRGQFSDALCFGILSTCVLWALDVRYFLFIGAFAGAANLIPYVGPFAGAFPAVVVTLIDTGDVTRVFHVILAFVLMKLVDDFVIQPLVMARNVHLHPLLVLLACFAGAELYGVLGTLLAVPVAGFLKVVLQESLVTLRKYRFG
jgi:predicted PurR-regulated permease PerM